MISRAVLSSLLSVTVSTAVLVAPASSHAAALDEPGTVLGLDSPDKAAGKALTEALRKAFAKRGLSGGEPVSLAELRLSMGCDNDDAKCLAEGGKSLQVRRLVYGSLKKSGGGNFQVRLVLLDVESATVQQETTTPVTAAQLKADKIDTTADELASNLLPEETDSQPLPADDVTPAEPSTVDQPKKQRDKKYDWGPYKPRPKWKWIGFGVSLGLMVAAAATAVGLGIAIRPGGSMRRKLLDTAEESLTDGSDTNNVDPHADYNLCDYAGQTITPMNGMPGVRNAKVTKVCNQANGMKIGANVSIAVAAVAAASTIVFTTLLFVRKNKSPAAAAMAKRGVSFGIAPRVEGGMMAAGGFKF